MLKWLCRVGICLSVLDVLCIGPVFGQVRAPVRGRAPSRGGGTAADPNAPKGVYPTSQGILKSITGSQLLLELDDDHEMKFRITRKTKFFSQDKQGTQEIKASSLHPGQTVAVDMQTTLDGAFEAVHITLQAPPETEAPKETPKQ